MACFFVVIFVLLTCTSGSPVHSNHEQTKESYFSPKKISDFTVDNREAGEEYNKKIEMDQTRGTELFEIPAHPGVYRRVPLNDFKPSSISSSQDLEDVQKENGRCICTQFTPFCCRR